MRKTFSVTLLLLALLAPQSPVYAWGDTGHMVVAQIALNRLNAKARKRVIELLVPNTDMRDRRGLVYFCNRTYDPVTIANWMDDMRDDSLHDDLKEWHHMNRSPLVVDNLTITPEPPRKDVQERLEFFIEELKQKQAAANDGRYDARDKELAEVLGYLYHLVGDIHQPLHTTTQYSNAHKRGNLGGNLFLVRVPGTNVKNLHSFWDGAGGLFGSGFIGRPLDEEGSQAISDFANAITQQYKADDPQQADWKKLEPADWARESNEISKGFVYKQITEAPANALAVIPSAPYTEEAQKISARRIAFAGYRLGELLNNILGQP
jgi:hypothetical protein